MAFFGNLFDFNHDGKLDAFEKAADFASFAEMMEEEEKNEKLRMAGLDQDDLEDLEEEERREAMEDAGLDPDDFDY